MIVIYQTERGVSGMMVPFSLLKKAAADIPDSDIHVPDDLLVKKISVLQPEESDDHVLFLYRKPPEESLPYILVKGGDRRLLAVYSALSEELSGYDIWEEKLLECLRERKGMNELLETGFQMIGNPITLYDNSMRLAGTGGIPNEGIEENWVSINGQRYIKPETWVYSKDVDLPVLHEQMRTPEIIVNGGVRMFQCPVIAGERTLGLMTIPLVWRDLDETYLPVIQTFLSFVGQMMEIEKRQVMQAYSQVSFLRDVFLGEKTMTKELAAHYLNILGLGPDSIFRIMVLAPAEHDASYDWNNVLYSRTIDGIFSTNHKLMVNDSLCVLITDPPSKEELLADHSFPLFLETARLKAGFSMRTASFANLRGCYLQALFSLRGDERIAFYEGRAADHLLSAADEFLDLEMFISEPVRRLAALDKNGDLVKTLLVYLLTDRSYQACSAYLNIHKSTVKYRLDRIFDIIGTLTEMTLDEKKDLLLSLLAAEYRRRQSGS